MRPNEMEALCLDSIAGTVELGFPEDKATLTLVTPKGWKAPPKFPRGYLLQVKDNGDRIWSFRADRLLAWLRANEVEAADAA